MGRTKREVRIMKRRMKRRVARMNESRRTDEGEGGKDKGDGGREKCR